MKNSKFFTIVILNLIQDLYKSFFGFRIKSGMTESGQALLIVVLVMVIALTVGLSVASRSIINLRTSTDEANSQKAFSAAEAGVERALKLNTPITETIPLNNNSNIKTVNIKNIGGNDDPFLVNGGNTVQQDDGVDVWLSDQSYNTPMGVVNNFGIAWGDPSENCAGPQKPAAMEVIVVYAPKTNPTTKRYTFDPCSSSRSNNFDDNVDQGAYLIEGQTFKYRTKLNGSGTDNIEIDNGLIMRMIPVYASTKIAVYPCNNGGNGCATLPEQGKIIESTGEAGGAQRKVIYYQGFRKVPSEFFQYALFSH